MAFRVRHLDLATMQVAENVEHASSEDAARAQCEGRGLRVLSIRKESQRLWGAGSATIAQELSGHELLILCSELRTLLVAGLSVVEALEALEAHHSSRARSRGGDESFYGQLLRRLRAGRSLSAALADLGGIPPLLVASVQSSERTSNLVEALDGYMRYARMVNTMRTKLISAALYPAIVSAMGLVITVFLLWVVVPRFGALYAQMGPGVGGVTKVLLNLSMALQEMPWLIPTGIALLGMAAAMLITGGRWRQIALSVVSSVPWLSRQARQFDLSRVFEALALLNKGGFSFREALEMSEGVALRSDSRAALEQAKQRVDRGQSVSTACEAAGLTDEITVRLLRASERGGDFSSVLQAIAARHASTFETFLERATRVLEPVLLLAVALLVGGMVIMLYMPIFDIASSIR